MKYIHKIALLLVLFFIGMEGGIADCTKDTTVRDNDFIRNAKVVDTCSAAFSSTVQGATDCYNANTSEADCGSAELDCNTNTEGPWSAGQDPCYGASDADIWYTFCPSSAGNWDVTMDVYDCCNGDGLQYSIFQGAKDSFTTYHDCSNQITPGTHTTNFDASSEADSGCVFINFDGYSGNCTSNSCCGPNDSDVCSVDVQIQCTDCNCALPIELSQYHIKATDEGVIMNWIANTQTDNDYFAIERSADGEEFKQIGRVEGEGDAQTARSYSFLDKEPQNGDNYYRIKQVDYDGSTDYSKIKQVYYTSPEKFHISQLNTTTNDQLRINIESIKESTGKLIVYNLTGGEEVKKDINYKVGTNYYNLDINNLEEGIYIISVIQNNNESLHQKFTKF